MEPTAAELKAELEELERQKVLLDEEVGALQAELLEAEAELEAVKASQNLAPPVLLADALVEYRDHVREMIRPDDPQDAQMEGILFDVLFGLARTSLAPPVKGIK